MFRSCREEKQRGQDGIGHQNREQGMNDRLGGGQADTLRTAFNLEARVTSNRDDEPGENETFACYRAAAISVMALTVTGKGVDSSGRWRRKLIIRSRERMLASNLGLVPAI